MAHHHKSNKEVEGDPDTGHGRGMPLRPDADELAARTQADRAELREEQAQEAAARTRRPGLPSGLRPATPDL
ncbi:hypothetical protein [Streptomyces tropicalis]|uniref:Uncharacterized protein n=1 Tax=Streptomyces tropicalis TaxID=3034234 RepID=A0ABT6A6H5_9ACTN|nr:hypothetical protein [Streptomyces tropicalis]MDF3300257.1 hypothetical protein [Streptomyces tropicalis]